jgi:drug/metabolite transporter (DMT)-like permease
MNTTPRKSRLDLFAMVLLTVLCASWGVQQVAAKISIQGISPVLQVGLRSAGAALLVWLWASVRGVRLFERDGTLWLGAAIAFFFGAEFVLIYWGLDYTSASRGVVFLYCMPFFVALGAHAFIPAERLDVVKIAGLVAAFLGIVVAFSDALALPTSRELLGDSLLLLAAVAWAAATVMIKATRLARLSPHKVLFYQLAGSALMALPISFLIGEPGITDLSVPVLVAFGYQTIWVAAITYLAWFWLIGRYPASTLSAFTFLTPLFGILAGATLLGEKVTPSLIVAMALVGVGIYLVNRAPQPTGATS